MRFDLKVTGEVTIRIPSLDRVVDFWEGTQQKEIDALTAEVKALTADLTTHRTGLETAIEQQSKG